MQGWMYRLGVQIKEWGERVHSAEVQRLGIAVMDCALNMRGR